jgi:AcrR family transcriptional regulator
VVVFAAQGDPRRSMELLWRAHHDADRTAPARPGPRQGLTVDAIVEAAIALADAEGVGAVSMRAVGERVGRSGMALYTYVPGKSELLDLMYDQTHAELPADYDLTDGWRSAIVRWAEDLWSCYLRHPWVLQVSPARPVLGPHEYVLLESAARILYPTGLAASSMRRIIGSLINFVRGAAQTIAETRLAPHATGSSDDEWWLARSAMLTEVAPDFAERFPTVTRMERDGAFRLDDETVPYLEQEAHEMFRAGLELLLDGIEAAIDRETGAASS